MKWLYVRSIGIVLRDDDYYKDYQETGHIYTLVEEYQLHGNTNPAYGSLDFQGYQ